MPGAHRPLFRMSGIRIQVSIYTSALPGTRIRQASFPLVNRLTEVCSRVILLDHASQRVVRRRESGRREILVRVPFRGWNLDSFDNIS